MFEQIDKSINKKVNLSSNSFSRYAVHAVLACLFLALGIAIILAIAIRGEGISHGLGEMLHVFMFSWPLVMILYMNVELDTPNMLRMTAGVYRKKVNFSLAAETLFTCILFNLIGGALFSFLVSLTVPFQDLPKDSFFFTSIVEELEKTTPQILVEAVFVSTIVNTAVLVSMRMKSDVGKVTAIILTIFIFAFLGFEYVIVNFLVFSLAYFASNGAIEAFIVGNVVHNLFWALTGDFIGSGLVVGLSYAWLDKDNRNLTYFD